MPSTIALPPAAPAEGQSVADLILDYLVLEGATRIFGVPGAAIVTLLRRLHERPEFNYVVCRHESGAAYMADGYYKATGRPGIVLVTSGPGSTNALTGMMNAHFGGSAVMILTGEVAEMYLGRGFLQEGSDCGLNMREIFAAATRYSADIVDPFSAPILLEQALRDMMAVPRRAVRLGISENVAAACRVAPALPGGGAEFVAPRPPLSTAAYRSLPMGAPADGVGRALEVLSQAQRPLILLGSGCREALRDPATAAALRNVVERWQIPVMTTSDGKGVFPETHELSLRTYGFSGCQWPQFWMIGAHGEVAHDALLVIGSSLGELATYKWNPMLVPRGAFLQVDLDQSIIGRGFPVTDGIVAEAGAFLRALWDGASGWPRDGDLVDGRRSALAALKATHPPMVSPADYASDAAPLQPAALCRVLNEVLPEDALVFVDAGNCVGWALHCLVIDRHQELHISLTMGAMGSGVCGVIGARYGRPDRLAVALVGDGALLMHLGEISTAAAHAIGAILVVLVDNDLRMVSQGMDRILNQPGAYDDAYRLGRPDLHKVAEGLGADAYTLTCPADLRAVWPAVAQGAGQGRPQVLLARIDTKAAPPFWIPPYASGQVD